MGTCYTLYCPEKKTALYVDKASKWGHLDLHYDTIDELLYENTTGEEGDEDWDEESALTEWGREVFASIEEWSNREGVTTYKVWNDCSGEDEPWLDYATKNWDRRPGWTMYDALGDLSLDWTTRTGQGPSSPRWVRWPLRCSETYFSQAGSQDALAKVSVYLQLQGPQSHPSYAGQSDTFHSQNAKMAEACRDSLAQCLDNEWPTPWSLQLLEKVHRAMATSDPIELETALLQVAAVSAAWMDDLNKAGGE